MQTAPPTSAQAPSVVTDEDANKARKAIADIERTERLVTTVLVVLGFGGLIFTAVNVTLFATDHHTHPAIAWMLDPLVSLALLGVLFIDGRLAAYGYKPGGWPFVLRWFAGLATWLMNCWASLYPDEKFTGWPANPDPAGLLLHSVIPFLVILLAEAGARYRQFCTDKKAHQKAIVAANQEQKEAKRRADAEAARQREETKHAAEEAERKRAADLAAEEKRTELEVRKARELAEAKAREIQATAEAEARRAERDRQEAEVRRRTEAEAREQQARIDRETAEHKAELERQRIITEAEAEAVKLKAEADARAAAQAREDRRRTAEARRTRTVEPTAVLPTTTAELTAETAPKATAVLPGATAETTALPAAQQTAKPRKLTAVPAAAPTAETGDVRGAEAKRKQIEEANFEAAVLQLLDDTPTRKEFAAVYGRSETWGRERYAEAEQLMAEDPGFAARVVAEAEKRGQRTAPAVAELSAG
ncbi:hypothetical protein HZZ00_37410 (plasmid) [Streptomyces sp. NEAU-sy36]|uniref:hypothetical protein n=1 Tax=unclassified Streptomyces TaxID=2593676 RepID=UPI0015D57091|nr:MULTISPECIES: hypothetical protein [unclassified Streptomyces]QLJ06712.1 hypothetical protein HZZ00_37410 [Streptomyces sp. NEAU-sy36]